MSLSAAGVFQHRSVKFKHWTHRYPRTEYLYDVHRAVVVGLSFFRRPLREPQRCIGHECEGRAERWFSRRLEHRLRIAREDLRRGVDDLWKDTGLNSDSPRESESG